MTSGYFSRDRRGNIATFAAFLAVPLIFAVGAGLDLARVSSARGKLQAAVDGAALAVMKEAAFQQAEADRIASRMMSVNFGTDYQALTVSFSEFGATVRASTKVDLTLAKVLGFDSLDAEVTGTAEYPPTKYEIALVLDTTGSMEGVKLAEMKKAAQRMVEELTETEILRRRVKFALVPFSTFVNVGSGQASSDWIDAAGALQLPNDPIPAGVSRLEIFRNFGQTWKGCVETRIEVGEEAYSIDDTPPDPAKPRTLFVPALAPDEGGNHRIFPNDYAADDTLAGLGVSFDAAGRPQYLRGLTLAASYPFYANDTTPQGPNMGCDAQPIRPLTNDYDALKRDIVALKAAGSTNITEGMAWGNRVLSPGEPFAEGLPFDADVEKIVVLLTDGDNTITALPNKLQSAYSAMGYLVDGRWNDAYKQTAKGKHGNAYGTCKGAGASDDKGSGSLPKVPCRTAAAGSKPSAAAVTAAMNARTQAACTETKREDRVEVFTIRLEVDSASSSDLLRNCASDASHYYDATDASQLQAIFDEIANRIKTLRIAS